MSEWYTLSENLYRAYRLTGNPKYKDFADVWQYTHYWNQFLAATDPNIEKLHAYSHVNTLSGAAMSYDVTGDSQFLKVLTNAYDYFDRTQFYATGGFGPSEKFVVGDGSLGKSLENDSNNFETVCGSWAGFKLARYLMMFTGEARYGDWVEKLLYNGIGAALPMMPDGRTFYYADYRLAGCRKIYGAIHELGTEWRWPCCSGTYPQAVADYHNIIYYRNAEGLFVNLFVPSEVAWTHTGTEIKLIQETAYPEADTTRLTVQAPKAIPFALKFRVPGWTKGVTVKLNDLPLNVVATPGNWATIQRTWNPGDRVTIQIPMELTAVPVDKQHPNRVAFRYGPVVLVRTEESFQVPSRTELSRGISPGGKPLEFKTEEGARGNLVPFYQIGNGVPYRMYLDLNA